MLLEYFENVRNCYCHIPYTFKHIIAFIKTEKRIVKKVRVKSYVHDFDKLILYALSPITLGSVKKIHDRHRGKSSHHVESGKDYLSMIIDWECARLTKPDKPLTARETLNKYYPIMKDHIEPILKKYEL